MGGGKKTKWLGGYVTQVQGNFQEIWGILSGFVTQDFERRGGEEARSEEARGGERRRGGEEARKQGAEARRRGGEEARSEEARGGEEARRRGGEEARRRGERGRRGDTLKPMRQPRTSA